MKTDPRYLSERLRAATENLASLIVIALLTGFLLSITANLVTEFVTTLSPRWVWLLLSVVLTLLPPLFFVWYVYSSGDAADAIVEVVLPFHVTAREAEILIADAYPVTKLMRLSFHEIMSDTQNRAAFLKDWSPQERPFQGMVRRCVNDLLVRAVLSALREHSKQTLTVQRAFTRHRWRMPKLSVRKVEPDDWPLRLKENLCFTSQNRTAPKTISIPEDMTLDIQEKKDADGMERTEIALKSRYGKVIFAISPYAQRVNLESREGFILCRYCGVSRQEDLWLAKFYIQMTAQISVWKIFSPQLRKTFLPWIEGIFECLENELDWTRCLDGNLERMVRKIAERMEDFPMTQAIQQDKKAEE